MAPGKIVHAWTHDGDIPGPLIRAHVGDRVIVHFTNDLLPLPTIHWHGVRVPIEMDGVADVSQPGMQRGDTFTDDFVVATEGCTGITHAHRATRVPSATCRDIDDCAGDSQ